MPGGRPRKTTKDLPVDWKKIILDNMAEGASREEIAGELLLISEDLYSRFLLDEPEFAETIKKGLALSRRWWDKKGRINLENKNFQYVGWYMNMKNRFGWRDNSYNEHVGKDGGPLVDKVTYRIEEGNE